MNEARKLKMSFLTNDSSPFPCVHPFQPRHFRDCNYTIIPCHSTQPFLRPNVRLHPSTKFKLGNGEIFLSCFGIRLDLKQNLGTNRLCVVCKRIYSIFKVSDLYLFAPTPFIRPALLQDFTPAT